MKYSTGILIIFLALGSAVNAQESSWSAQCGIVYIIPNGEFQALRPNGKIVMSDITDGYGLKLGLSRQVSKRSFVEFDVFVFSKHHFIIHQDFPDQSTFESSDKLHPFILTLGYGFSILQHKKWALQLVADLSFISYNDVLLASAGPPFDRTAPLDIKSKNNFRGGFHINVKKDIAHSININLSAGLLINRFQGSFATEDDLDPFSDIDLGFNPLMLSFGLEYQF